MEDITIVFFVEKSTKKTDFLWFSARSAEFFLGFCEFFFCGFEKFQSFEVFFEVFFVVLARSAEKR